MTTSRSIARNAWRQACIRPEGIDGLFVPDDERPTASTLHHSLGALNNLLLLPLFVLIFAEIFARHSARDFGIASDILGVSFFCEWAVGLFLARRRRAYLSNMWLLADLVSSLPLATMLQAARITRIARLLRLLKLLHVFRARRFRFLWRRAAHAIGISVSIAVSGAIALKALEPETVASWSDALWWSTVTLTTVGYGDISPTSAMGRLFAAVVMVTGVGAFSYMAGLMAGAIFDPDEQDVAKSLASVHAKLDAVLEQQTTAATLPEP